MKGMKTAGRKPTLIWVLTAIFFGLTANAGFGGGYGMLSGAELVSYADEEDGISELLSEFQKETHCSSVSIAVYDHGTLRYYGNQDGMYQIGSMTKAFTALAVTKLIREGYFAKESRVQDLLPGFEAYYENTTAPITVGQLLSQTSGYTNNEIDYPSASEGMTLSEWVRSISGKELQSAPGESYAYSNVNYNLLGALIEETTGRSYRDYMEKEILSPLGLDGVSVGMPENGASVIEGSKAGFRRVFRYEIPVREGAVPAGYFYSDIESMGRWMEIWLGQAKIPDEYRELVSEVKAGLTAEGDYDCGWERFSNGVNGHSGGTPNYSSRLVFSDETCSGVCVLANLNAASSVDSLCNGVYDFITEGKQGGIRTDVWTVFDRIFTLVTLFGIVLLLLIPRIGKRGVLLALALTETVLLITLIIVLPLIFGAGMGQILFIWAPYSLAGGMLILLTGSVGFWIRFLTVRKT